MQKFPDFVPAFSHHLKTVMRDGSQFTGMLFHPRIDGGIPLDSAVESQQFRSHRRFTFFELYGYAQFPDADKPLAIRKRGGVTRKYRFPSSGHDKPVAFSCKGVTSFT